ncbi:hypothetical protein HAX54_011170, partial [Datura stramonium]|nr:hypothetical protein [Datura stramonium]
DTTRASNSSVRPKGLCTLTERCVTYKLVLSYAIQASQGARIIMKRLRGYTMLIEKYE